MDRILNTNKEPKLIAEGRPLVNTRNALLPNAEHKTGISFTIEEIHKRAETISPLLKDFLGMRPPTHWGINE